jgi:YVTN family beta-propeller protein
VSQEHTLEGTSVGIYEVRARIGRGGMGEVYLARDTRLGRPVALKVLPERFASDARFRERLLRESRLAASLDHPNVVPVYDAGEADGRLFIAMRYVDGIDLKALLRDAAPLAPERVMIIAGQLAEALDAAHQRGLVHRDVKPSNVLVDQQGNRDHAYLADFGLTQTPAAAGPADGQLMGTVDYVAPEQIRGGVVDGRADQYALGCLLFECLTGSLPFRDRSEVAAIFAHLEEPAPVASERHRALPPAVDAVLERAMAKEPEQRFDSCRELVAATHDALGLAPPPPPPPRRARWLVPVLALAVVVSAVAAVALGVGRGSPASPAGPHGVLTQIDPRTNLVRGRTSVPGYPQAVAWTVGGIWVADFREGVLWRYDPSTASLQRIASNGEPRDIAALGDQVYVAVDDNALTGSVARYDAASGERLDSLTPELACALASGAGVVWAAGCPFVDRLSTDAHALRRLRHIFLPFQPPYSASTVRVQFREMAVGAGSLWVLGDALDRRVWRLDLRRGTIQKTIALPFPPRSVVVADGTAWITDGLHDTVVPIDARSNRVLPAVAVGRGAAGVTATPGAVWVANAIDGTVSRIDPRSRRVVATVRVGGSPSEIDAGPDGVWVTSHAL